MRKLIFVWLACIIAITACAILCHNTMKQSIYYHTYDNQYALLEQAKDQLNQGKTVENLVSEIQIETSKQCFIVVYDEVHAISYTNATFNELPLTVPLTLVIHDDYHEDIYTPNETLKFATVSTSYDTGHIIVGQTMEKYDALYQESMNDLLYIYSFLCIGIFPILLVFHLLTKNHKA